MNYFSRQYLLLEDKLKIKPLRDVILFVVITLTIHFLYRLWAYQFHYYVFGWQILPPQAHMFFVDLLFNTSKWVMEHILCIPFDVNGYEFMIRNPDYPAHGQEWVFRLQVLYGCSGLKQFIQFALLMLVFPGPLKHKLWYIPMGVLLVFLTNVFRIVSLAEIVRFSPSSFQWAHDYVFRPFFYVVIFSLWVIWVEYFKNKKKFRWKLLFVKNLFSKTSAKPSE
ncbi:MAG: exosortase/archaeosortase family protein [Bacteroidota bacterium]